MQKCMYAYVMILYTYIYAEYILQHHEDDTKSQVSLVEVSILYVYFILTYMYMYMYSSGLI